MKKDIAPQNVKAAGARIFTTPTQATQAAVNGRPSPDEVARKAYFIYLDQGSPQGQDVQHWLAAEAQILSDSKQTRPRMA